MKKLIIPLLCGILLALCCSCREAEPESLTGDSDPSESAESIMHAENTDGLSNIIPMDSDGVYFTRYYSLEEFSSIVEGKSTKEDLFALFPGEYYLELQGGHYSTMVFPLEDGRTIGFCINHDDLVFQITFDEEPIRVITDQEP